MNLSWTDSIFFYRTRKISISTLLFICKPSVGKPSCNHYKGPLIFPKRHNLRSPFPAKYTLCSYQPEAMFSSQVWGLGRLQAYYFSSGSRQSIWPDGHNLSKLIWRECSQWFQNKYHLNLHHWYQREKKTIFPHGTFIKKRCPSSSHCTGTVAAQ